MRTLKILTLHFFNRFFQNETIPFKEATTAKVASLLSILAGASGALAYWENLKYIVAPLLYPYRTGIMDTSWKENFIFLSFSMVIMALVSLIEWDEIFLKKRDYANLSPIPVRSITLFASKLLGLAGFVWLFSLSMTILSSPIFGFGRAKAYGNSLGLFLKISFAHGISVFASNLFVFLFIMCLSGFLILLMGERRAEKLSVYFQSAAFVIFLSFFGIFDKLYSGISLAKVNKFPLSLLPPMWFSGLYEELAGINLKGFSRLSLTGLGVIFSLMIVLILEYFLLYKKQTRTISRKTIHLSIGISKSESILNRWVFTNPLQRALFQFIKTVMGRSRKHRLVFSLYISVIAGIFGVKIARLLYSCSFHSVFLYQFIHLFFLAIVLGFRMVVDIPWFIEGNWVFKITEKKGKENYLKGIKKSFFVLYLFPGFLVVLILYSLLWGPKLAFMEGLYGLLSSLILLELAFAKYRKIPFSCTTVPGKMKLHKFWFFYILGIYIYTHILGIIGKLASEQEIYFFFIYFLLGILILIMKKFSMKKWEIIYEETPEPVVMSLGLRDD